MVEKIKMAKEEKYLREQNEKREKQVDYRIHVKSSSSTIIKQIKEQVQTSAQSQGNPYLTNTSLHYLQRVVRITHHYCASLDRETKTEQKDRKKNEL